MDCPHCSGAGLIQETEPVESARPCPVCEGSGELVAQKSELDRFTAMLARKFITFAKRDGAGRAAGMIVIEIKTHAIEGDTLATFVFTKSGELSFIRNPVADAR